MPGDDERLIVLVGGGIDTLARLIEISAFKRLMFGPPGQDVVVTVDPASPDGDRQVETTGHTKWGETIRQLIIDDMVVMEPVSARARTCFEVPIADEPQLRVGKRPLLGHPHRDWEHRLKPNRKRHRKGR